MSLLPPLPCLNNALTLEVIYTHKKHVCHSIWFKCWWSCQRGSSRQCLRENWVSSSTLYPPLLSVCSQFALHSKKGRRCADLQVQWDRQIQIIKLTWWQRQIWQNTQETGCWLAESHEHAHNCAETCEC